MIAVYLMLASNALPEREAWWMWCVAFGVYTFIVVPYVAWWVLKDSRLETRHLLGTIDYGVMVISVFSDWRGVSRFVGLLHGLMTVWKLCSSWVRSLCK